MLTIRLQRAGKKNKPEFRVILAEKTAAAGKKFIEVLGSYNPRTKALGFKDESRLKYWIAQHVEISPTVHNLLVGKNLLESKKVKSFSVPTKVKKKREEAEAKAKAEAEAKAQADAAPETPAEPATPQAAPEGTAEPEVAKTEEPATSEQPAA